jgi:hypothetical protein
MTAYHSARFSQSDGAEWVNAAKFCQVAAEGRSRALQSNTYTQIWGQPSSGSEDVSYAIVSRSGGFTSELAQEVLLLTDGSARIVLIYR